MFLNMISRCHHVKDRCISKGNKSSKITKPISRSPHFQLKFIEGKNKKTKISYAHSNSATRVKKETTPKYSKLKDKTKKNNKPFID